jgi:ankyrin repeat protein
MRRYNRFQRKFNISEGADVNAKDNRGRTSLLEAIRLERDDVVRWLRENGAVE